MITVFHNPRFLWEGEKPALHRCDEVGTVNTDDPDEAFRLTNSIDRHWTTNEQVSSYRRDARSTSVGDMLVRDDGKTWIVASCGFTEVERPLVYANWTGRRADLESLRARCRELAIPLADTELGHDHELVLRQQSVPALIAALGVVSQLIREVNDAAGGHRAQASDERLCVRFVLENSPIEWPAHGERDPLGSICSCSLLNTLHPCSPHYY